MCTGEVGEGPVVESSVELAVHKAAGRVEDFPGPAVSSDAAVAFATRAGGARETEKIFRQNIETEAGVIGGAVEKVGAITAGAVEKVGAVTDGAVEKVGAITGGAVEKVGAVLEDADEADEITIEEIVIDSIIDKIAGGEAAHDNTAGESEAIRDKIAEGGEAARDKTAEEGEAIHDKIARDEAVHDNTAGERVEEFTVDPSIEAILEAAERIDEEVKGPRFESSPQ